MSKHRHPGMRLMLETIDVELLKIISSHSTFSFAEVKAGWQIVAGSYDKLIFATTEANKIGVSLADMCDLLVRGSWC